VSDELGVIVCQNQRISHELVLMCAGGPPQRQPQAPALESVEKICTTSVAEVHKAAEDNNNEENEYSRLMRPWAR